MKYLFYTLLLLFSFNVQAQVDTNSIWYEPTDTLVSGNYIGYGNSTSQVYPIDTVRTYLEVQKKYQTQLNVVTAKLKQLDQRNVYNIPEVIELRQDIQWRMFVLDEYRKAETVYFDPYTYTLEGADVSKCLAVKRVDLSYENFRAWCYQNFK